MNFERLMDKLTQTKSLDLYATVLDALVEMVGPDITPQKLTELASADNVEVREIVALHPNTPPLAKVWLKSDYRQSMTLEEFLAAATPSAPPSAT